MLDQIIGDSWIPIIGDEFSKPYMQKLSQWLEYQRKSATIYPESEDVFKALKLCPFDKVKVVILGQDPYHNGVADGLAFSFRGGQRQSVGKKQSLDLILKEIEDDVYDGFNVNYDYDLSYLAKQGVLLLNTVLTVFRGKPLSHAKTGTSPGVGWEILTHKILLELWRNESPKVFLLWGNHAQNEFDKVLVSDEQINGWKNYDQHQILKSVHPAADLYKLNDFGDVKKDPPNTFAGCKHFSLANDYLKSKFIEPINWFNTQEPYSNKDFAATYCPI